MVFIYVDWDVCGILLGWYNDNYTVAQYGLFVVYLRWQMMPTARRAVYGANLELLPRKWLT